MIRTIALDQGWRTTAEAEHGALEQVSELGLRAVLACTHFLLAADGQVPRVAVTAQVADAGPDSVRGPVATLRSAGEDLDRLLAAHVTGRSGRAFVFPGMAALDRIVTVGRLLTESAVDDVVTLGGDVARTADRIDTQNHLRPEFSAGRLVLRTRPAVGVDLVPFEQPNPTPCCPDHS
jgi:hypothetical protein